jgi:hypothetical protein
MKSKLLLGLAVGLLLFACSPQTAKQSPVDVGAIQTAAVETALANPPETNTPVPTITFTSAPGSQNVFAWNYIAEQESGGIKLQIARVLIGEKSALQQNFSENLFGDVPVVGMLIFIVTNTTSDKTISVYPDQGVVIVGSEQIELREYMMLGNFGEHIGGDIFPGVKKIGGLWFGIKRTPLSDVLKMKIVINRPTDESISPLGPDFIFELDLSNRQFEPLPDELKF